MSGDDDSNGWQLMESDPGVFSELLKSVGVPLIVDDLYSLDPDTLAFLKPIHALVFLFKWRSSSAEAHIPPSASGTSDADFPGFFAHQVVNNACATLAVINAVGNIPAIAKGPNLSEMLAFSSGMDPQTTGIVVTNADWLREAHNSLSPPSAFSLDGLGLPRRSEDAYHFVVYVPVNGHLYELDGLKEHPVKHAKYDDDAGEGWLRVARETIESRIATYPEGALEFSLLAVRDDPLPSLQAQLAVEGSGPAAHELVEKIANENSKRERWAFENSLRRHNHMGLVHALLSAMAKAGALQPATEKAKESMKERIARARAKGEAMDED